jgi:serine O-acetyltransferase
MNMQQLAISRDQYPTDSGTETVSLTDERIVPAQKSDTNAMNTIWKRLRLDVLEMARSEPMLAAYLHDMVLRHISLEGAMAYLLANKLASPYLSTTSLRDIIYETLDASPGIRLAVRYDMEAVVERDPAARTFAHPFLNYKGFHALQAYRITHWLWINGRQQLALHLQNRISEAFDVDIHPAAVIGRGILVDHGSGVVIGETAVVGDNVSILHEVTLGGTGKEGGDRHPKVESGVMIGAGAKILGNIRIGAGSKIAAGSVVLAEVPPHSTVAGIPARVVGRLMAEEPAHQMNQHIEFDYCI